VLRKLFERSDSRSARRSPAGEALATVAAEPDIVGNPHLATRVVLLTGAARDRTMRDLLEQRGVPPSSVIRGRFPDIMGL
jgi:hypothetical protein